MTSANSSTMKYEVREFTSHLSTWRDRTQNRTVNKKPKRTKRRRTNERTVAQMEKDGDNNDDNNDDKEKRLRPLCGIKKTYMAPPGSEPSSDPAMLLCHHVSLFLFVTRKEGKKTMESSCGRRLAEMMPARLLQGETNSNDIIIIIILHHFYYHQFSHGSEWGGNSTKST